MQKFLIIKIIKILDDFWKKNFF